MGSTETCGNMNGTLGGCLSGRRPARLVLAAVLAFALAFPFTLGAGPASAQDLKGEVTIEQLYVNAPAFEKNALAFTPDPGAIERMGRIDGQLDILVFFGTWCPDSVQEVPKLLKILETANNPNISIELHAVDSAIEDGAGFAHEYGVRKVPNIIFLRNGTEIGRIIEHPETTMEDAVLRIALSGSRAAY